MGGDHKCPVCQATFTRPQHVARHMRSHTGDRPYKCQHCGDQFARSDLLSRHINKCHANEKPTTNDANTRRKGTASASRATTSKQACDQCVQSSLPCDGCNPCSKCVNRKCRCTFVKFHRQTAPAGPGHNLRPPAFSGHLQSYPGPHADDFILDLPSLTVPSMVSADTASYPQGYTYPQIYPSDNPASLTMSAPQGGMDSDFSAKYRAQAELGHSGAVPTRSDIMPGLYTDPQTTSSWQGWSQESPADPNFAAQNEMNINGGQTMAGGRYFHNNELKNMLIDGDLQSAMSRQYMAAAVGGERRSDGQINAFPPSGYPGSTTGGRPRRDSVDQFSSDGSTASHSISSSASSSNLQLPLGDMSGVPQPRMGYPEHGQNNYLASHPSQMRKQGEGGVSSAFGLMSLDDPNVLASISADGHPFFPVNIPPGDPNSTPMGHKPHDSHHQRNSTTGHSAEAMHTPGSSREAETKELKDFWKAYMRMPLSGSGSIPPADQRPPLSPTHSKRLVRVASLPSVKTPPAVGYDQPQYPGMAVNKPAANVSSSVRPTRHGNHDDLRSYEAAVLARKTPMNLNLVPRRRGTGASSASSSPQAPPASDFKFARPCNASSSLAGAFGDQGEIRVGSVTFAPDQVKVNTVESSRESSVEDPSDGDNKTRPSFKRLASQTLGPANSKRAHGGGGGGGEEKDNDITPNGAPVTRPMLNGHGMGFTNQNVYPQREVVGLAERRRRMSVPHPRQTD